MVPAYCLTRPFEKQLEVGVAMLPTTQGVCRHKRVLHYVLPLLPFDGARYCAAFEGCARNEEYALRERHLMKTPDKDPVGVDAYMRPFAQMLPRAVVDPWSPKQVLAHRSARLRKRYADAYDSLELNPLGPEDSRVSAFVKFEKEWADEIAGKTPRAIQYRTPRYTATLAQYLMPVEHALFKIDRHGHECGVEERLFAKGMNSFQVAKRLQAMHKWSNTKWILLDHSRFDANVTVDHIRWESKIYKRMVAGPTRELDELMRKQLFNRGRTGSGLRYTCHGKKMSGEYNTGLGDSAINAALILKWVEGTKAEVLVNGDDSVVAISTEDYHRLDMLYFDKMGWTTKIEVVHDFHQVEFCQSRPVEVQPGNWRMVRNPWRVLNRSICTIQRYHGEAWKGYLRAVAQCEYACNFGVPVLEAFSHYIRRHAGDAKAVKLPRHLAFRAKLEPDLKMRKLVTHACARTSMALAWDMSEQEQLAIEQYLAAADHSEHVSRLITEPVGRPVCDGGDAYAYGCVLGRTGDHA